MPVRARTLLGMWRTATATNIQATYSAGCALYVLQSDWGAGVVCGGKLCGVVSRSARAAGGAAGGAAGTASRDEPQCGDTHAAQSVARWRRFLHCAHTLRACGRWLLSESLNRARLLVVVTMALYFE